MLHIVDEGAGRPVVLLHAYPCDNTLWDAQAAALLAAGYRVVRPDLPGFGASELSDAPPAMAAMADAVFEVLDAQGIESFALGGLSMGGYAAMQMLRQQPDRILALALIDTKATPDGEAARAVREETAAKALAAGSLVPLTEGMLGGLLGESTRAAKPEVVERTKLWISRADAAAAAWSMRAMATRPDSLPALTAFNRPSIVICGDEDALSSMAEHRLMADALPNSKLIVIDGCGHLSAIERPDQVSTALLEFLDRADLG